MAACIRATSRVSPSISLESTAVRYPRFSARRAAASSASRLLPMTVLRTRWKIGSPGLGVSATSPDAPRSSRSRTAAGMRSRMAYLSRMSSAPRIGRVVRRGGSRADDVQVVADDVREQQRLDRRRRGQPRQLPSLDAGNVLADGVDLVDVGAACQQQAGDGLLLFERDARSGQRQQRRRAARDEADHQVVRLRLLARSPRSAPRRSTPRSSGTGCPHSFNSMRRSLARWPSFTLTSPPVIRRPQHALRRARHGCSGLAGAHHIDVGGTARDPAI